MKIFISLTVFLKHDQSMNNVKRGAWGAYQTEFYVTYDLRAAREAQTLQFAMTDSN